MIWLVIVLSLVTYGIIEGIYLLSIAVFLFAWVYILIENNSLPTTHVHIDENGILVGGMNIDYSSINTFALIGIDGIPSFLRISLKKKISSSLNIPLSSTTNPAELKGFLLAYLDEDTTASFSNSDAIIHAMRL